MHWCHNWLKRAKELDGVERLDAEKRPAHIKAATLGMRLVLTEEILGSMQYEDAKVLDLLRHGSPLAGEIPKCDSFEELCKLCMMTMAQLLGEAPREIRPFWLPAKAVETLKWTNSCCRKHGTRFREDGQLDFFVKFLKAVFCLVGSLWCSGIRLV